MIVDGDDSGHKFALQPRGGQLARGPAACGEPVRRIIGEANSLVGSKAFDQIGNGNITRLSNGNYVVRSANWDNSAIVDAGAVTFCNGTTGCTGPITPSNSLVGSSASDNVGLASGVPA